MFVYICIYINKFPVTKILFLEWIRVIIDKNVVKQSLIAVCKTLLTAMTVAKELVYI
jgi:hypothetical protein